MKKFLRRVLLILLVLALILSVRALASPRLGFLHGLRYGMGPVTTGLFLGLPTEVDNRLSDFRELWCHYSVSCEGFPTEVSISYFSGMSINWVSAVADAGDRESADKLFESWTEQIREALGDKKGFYCGEIKRDSSTKYSLKMGTNTGATGITCTVEVDGTLVRVLCDNLF